MEEEKPTPDFRLIKKDEIINLPPKEPLTPKEIADGQAIIRELQTMDEASSAASEAEMEEGEQKKSKEPRRTNRQRTQRHRDDFV